MPKEPKKHAGGPRTRLRRPKTTCVVTNRVSARCMTCGRRPARVHIPEAGGLFCRWCCPCAGTLLERVTAATDRRIEREMEEKGVAH
jgi:hypothetical protein